jgi:hypothetical protein
VRVRPFDLASPEAEAARARLRDRILKGEVSIGGGMGATFWWSLADQAVPTNATDSLANIKSIFELPAPTNQALRVASLLLSFDGTAVNKPVLVQVIQATATGTFPSSSLSPSAGNNDGAAASTTVTTANVKYGTATGEGTIGAGNGIVQRLSPQAGEIYQLPLGREFWIPKAAFLRIRAVATIAVNVSLAVEVEE